MSHIILSKIGHAGCITLDRPEALNALSIDMVTQISAALSAWASDEAVKLVLIRSASSRAFCAGGDVREAVSIIKDNPELGAEPYFNAEYGFDLMLARYSKPLISLVDGVVMGGGFGVARLSDYMVVSSHIKMAMPETAIGLFPDVGASCFLRRAPLSAALMMGMTGTMIGAGDALSWQIADYHCPSEMFDELASALAAVTDRAQIEAVLASYHKAPPAPHFAMMMADIEQVFARPKLQDIAKQAEVLAQQGGKASWHQALSHKCPASIAAFWYMMTCLPVPASNEEAILRDYFLAVKMTKRPDFIEGVRAVLIDKDNAPRWAPRSVFEVSTDMLVDLFDFAGMKPLPE